jgi:serine protease Do
METSQRKSNRRPPVLFLLAVGFFVGSFAGAAFGVFFALSIDTGRLADDAGMSPGLLRSADRLPSEDQGVIASVKAVLPSVVSVAVIKEVSFYNQTGPMFPFEDFFGLSLPSQPNTGNKTPAQKQAVGGGTGFVISEDGLILTNRHVIDDQDAEYEVTMQDGKKYQAKVLDRDGLLDVAVLKIEAKGLPIAVLGDSDRLEIGQTVIAIGNALSEYRNTVTKGVVSGVGRRVVAGGQTGFSEIIEEAIQTDAAINPGNSGGPLIDLNGRVIGINTAVNREGQSIGFAIPVNAAKVVIDSIRSSGRIIRPWLGVRYVLVTPEMAAKEGWSKDYGAHITRGPRSGDKAVLPASPAAKAGIVEDDILLEVDGTRIDIEHPLSSLIGKKRMGDTVAVLLLRGGKEMTVQVTLGELPDEIN